ncbi:MAG TPA: ornithine cyclodeaminase family protein [Anaerovoracaceae bacterium]|nr:ornithine cyclodeaminase family protein [Anaerovoracaceae bacterium]
MFELKVLSKEDTEQLLEMNEVIRVVEEVYKLKAHGDTVVFPLVFHEFEPGKADMDIKSGWIKGIDIFGLKVVSWFGENIKKDLPALIGTIMVMDANTGVPMGILDGAHITGMRTGASGALGAKYLARNDSENLLIVGAGHIATFQIAATLTLIKSIKRVRIYAPINYLNAEKMASTIRNTLEKQFNMTVSSDVTFEAVKNIEAITRESDIIITVTPAKEPIIKKEWVKPGTHFSCIGADMEGKEEIDPEIFKDARVFVDDLNQCIDVGEIEIPIKKGILDKKDVAGELGDIIVKKTVGRQSNDQITVFDATGTALLDLMTARLALDAAEKTGRGVSVNL